MGIFTIGSKAQSGIITRLTRTSNWDFFSPGLRVPAAVPYDTPIRLVLSSEASYRRPADALNGVAIERRSLSRACSFS